MAGKYQWIMYCHQNAYGGGMAGELSRVKSIKEAQSALETFAREVYSDNVSATLYAYSDEGWEEATDFMNIGCPFDYPDRLLELGPRGGVKVSRT